MAILVFAHSIICVKRVWIKKRCPTSFVDMAKNNIYIVEVMGTTYPFITQYLIHKLSRNQGLKSRLNNVCQSLKNVCLFGWLVGWFFIGIILLYTHEHSLKVLWLSDLIWLIYSWYKKEKIRLVWQSEGMGREGKKGRGGV